MQQATFKNMVLLGNDTQLVPKCAVPEWHRGSIISEGISQSTERVALTMPGL